MERGSRLPWGAGAGTASRPAQPGVRDSVGKAIEIESKNDTGDANLHEDLGGVLLFSLLVFRRSKN
jgi:hypothetical protein